MNYTMCACILCNVCRCCHACACPHGPRQQCNTTASPRWYQKHFHHLQPNMVLHECIVFQRSTLPLQSKRWCWHTVGQARRDHAPILQLGPSTCTSPLPHHHTHTPALWCAQRWAGMTMAAVCVCLYRFDAAVTLVHVTGCIMCAG